MANINRPTGITILGYLLIVLGALTIILGVTLARHSGSLAAMGIPPQFLALGPALGAVLIVSGVINAAVGWGLLRLFNWARVVMLVIAGLGVVGAALGILSGGPGQIAADVQSLGAFAIDGLIIWYLLRPESRQAFAPRRPGEQHGVPPAEPPLPPGS
jgi:hypothetical protein